MKKQLLSMVVVAALAFPSAQLLTCTDASLEGLPDPPPPVQDDKMEVEGQICTQPPSSLTFPLRVVFLLDGSHSMKVTDPVDEKTGLSGRMKALIGVLTKLYLENEDVEVSVVRFSFAASCLTKRSVPGENGKPDKNTYFMPVNSPDDLDAVLSRLGSLETTESTTNMKGALEEASAALSNQMEQADLESLPLSTYHVVLLTDGLANEGTELENNTVEDLITSVESIVRVGRRYNVAKLSLSTALLEIKDKTGGEAIEKAADLLRNLADAGQGSFRSFQQGGEINFLDLDISALQRLFMVKTPVAFNLNAVVERDDILADSDGDGLSDRRELAIKTNRFDPDTDGDGCRDGLEWRLRTSGLDPLDPTDCKAKCSKLEQCLDLNKNGLCDCEKGKEGSCCVDKNKDGLCDCKDEDKDGRCDLSNYPDKDGDGLVDCEESYANGNISSPDFDNDGLIDFLELRAGTNPKVSEEDEDDDWDGVNNFLEVVSATDPFWVSPQGRSEMAYRYDMRAVASSQNKGDISCWSFSVKNITLTDVSAPKGTKQTVGPTGQGFTGWNRILIYAGEVPFDDPTTYARFRVACVEGRFVADGNYKEPASGSMELTDKDFVLFTKFDPAKHCVKPGDR